MTTARQATAKDAEDKDTGLQPPDGGVPNPPANIATQRYTAGEGWGVGQAAPADKFVEVGVDGQPKGKLQDKAPKGYGRQIVAKGDTITVAVHDALASLGGE